MREKENGSKAEIGGQQQFLTAKIQTAREGEFLR